jgi:SAM-dependent methyltransferase
VKFFKKSSLEPLAVAMSGVKLGDRLVVLGASDPGLIAALAVRAGLTGRACVVDASAEVSAATAAAVERDGALIESFAAPPAGLPFEPAAFDVAVIRNVLGDVDAGTRRAAAAEVFRVLRAGGRALVVEDLPRGGLAGLMGRGGGPDPRYAQEGGAAAALGHAGFKGVRLLAEREGLRFVEGTKGA